MSVYISDGSDGGREFHIVCDKCGVEVMVPLGRDGGPRAETPLELIGWQRIPGVRDLCPDCQSRTDIPQIRGRGH